MIPAFNSSGVLPPFVGHSATDAKGVSPYFTTIYEVVTQLGGSPERISLCRGLLKLRKELRILGIDQGVQWLNGSFCEDVETTRARPPADIDIVTLLVRPTSHKDDLGWKALITANIHLFDSVQAKANFGCDAYFIDLHNPADFTISQITYWFGLFTHQRVTHLWKGILQVPLESDDAVAEQFLNSIAS
jgi:hypothetical protein